MAFLPNVPNGGAYKGPNLTSLDKQLKRAMKKNQSLRSLHRNNGQEFRIMDSPQVPGPNAFLVAGNIQRDDYGRFPSTQKPKGPLRFNNQKA